VSHLSGKVNPLLLGRPFEGVLIGDDSKDVLLASDGGYGFVGKLSDLVSKNKAGKAVLKPSKGGLVMPPLEVANYDEDLIVAISNEGQDAHVPIEGTAAFSQG
jgi:topoisomerase-4 subunit A